MRQMKPSEINQYTKHGGFRSFLRKAFELGIRVDLFFDNDIRFVRLSYKNAVVFCHEGRLPIMRSMGNFTKQKTLTKIILATLGIQVPRGITAKSFKEALSLIRKKKLRYPLITKPLDGSLGKGVTWNILSERELRAASRHALLAYGKRKNISFLVEEMFIGNEYRVLVFDGRVVSCVQKVPAGVIGDGTSTIKELITRFDQTRQKGFEIRLDAVAKASLKKAGLSLSSVLEKNRFFQFRNNLNMSDGGRSIDMTDKMCPALKKIAVTAIRSVGLIYGGIDLLSKDISSKKEPYVILEINPHPFYNMNEKPLVEGKGANVSLLLLKKIFPSLKKG